ncbi:Glucokinase [Metarhizium anisopliae]|nr:Glucokinase [Metarhizium anisopliae]
MNTSDGEMPEATMPSLPNLAKKLNTSDDEMTEGNLFRWRSSLEYTLRSLWRMIATIQIQALVEETRRIVSLFEFSNADVNKHVKEFLKQIDKGLETDGTSYSQMATYVTEVPDGTETGQYLSAELIGTKFHIRSIKFNGDTTYSPKKRTIPVPKKLRSRTTARRLFAFLAREIESFLRQYHGDRVAGRPHRGTGPIQYQDKDKLRLGFTFGFPVNQSAIDKGLLIRWTEDFDIPDAIGKDVCDLLQDEIDNRHIPVKVSALVNNAVGTLMARSYTSRGRDRPVGSSFGTGTKGAYIKWIPGLEEDDNPTDKVIINTEWAAFDDRLTILPSTRWDAALDRQSTYPGAHMFQKRISEVFLCEILRLVIVDMINKFSLFQDVDLSFYNTDATPNIEKNSKIYQMWALDSSILSAAAADNTPDLSATRSMLKEKLSITAPSLEDTETFKAISAAIARRAARLSAVAIGAIALQSGKKLQDPGEGVLDVFVDGDLVEHYPGFQEMIYGALSIIDDIGPKGAAKIHITTAEGGSGVGAALMAKPSRLPDNWHNKLDGRLDGGLDGDLDSKLFYVLKPTEWLDATWENKILGAFVKEYPSPKNAYVECLKLYNDNSLWEDGQLFNSSSEREAYAFLESLGWKKEMGRVNLLKGKYLHRKSLRHVHEYFESARQDPDVMSRVLSWIKPGSNIPVCIVTGILICEDIEAWGEVPIATIGGAAAGVPSVDLSSNASFSARGSDGKAFVAGTRRSKIFALQLRPVTRRLLREGAPKIRKRQKLHRGVAHFGVDEESDDEESDDEENDDEENNNEGENDGW